jgi:hypothetical protein
MVKRMLEGVIFLQSAAVVLFASYAAMWINDKFHLGGYIKDEAK